jgi:sugar transferase (PEP-CTERM/EpsH1 system associated)
MVDVDSAKWAALATTNTPPKSWIYAREARVLQQFERVAAQRARATLVVSERERETLAAIAPDASIHVIGMGMDVSSLRPPATSATKEGAPTVVFCGVMNYAPNVEGAVWFARHVWPIVRSQRPDVRFQIVGSDPTTAVRRLASGEMGIEVTGRVPDVRPYLWDAAVSVAPLLTARGIQNKVLEAVAAGLPVVTTPVVMSGLPEYIRETCKAAKDPVAFASEVLALLSQPADVRRTGPLGVDLRALSWKRILEPVQELIADAGSERN